MSLQSTVMVSPHIVLLSMLNWSQCQVTYRAIEMTWIHSCLNEISNKAFSEYVASGVILWDILSKICYINICPIINYYSDTSPFNIYRVSQEECARLWESVPYVKLYRYNPKHLYPKLNGYRDNGHRKVWASGVSTYCTPSVTPYSSNAHARQLDTTS